MPPCTAIEWLKTEAENKLNEHRAEFPTEHDRERFIDELGTMLEVATEKRQRKVETELTGANAELAEQGCPLMARAMHDMREASVKEPAWAIWIAALPQGGWCAAGRREMNPEQAAMAKRMIRRLKEEWLPAATWDEIENAPGREGK